MTSEDIDTEELKLTVKGSSIESQFPFRLSQCVRLHNAVYAAGALPCSKPPTNQMFTICRHHQQPDSLQNQQNWISQADN
jgi:hypothetical protein